MMLEEGPAERARGSRVRRWVTGLAAAFVLVVIGGAVALKAMFPPEKLRALVVPQLEQRVGREVQLSAVRLRLFPRVAVRLEELAIANPPGFGSEPAVSMAALDLQVRVWPYLVRREIELGRVSLTGPVIRYQVKADGTNNLQGLGRAREAPVAAEVSPQAVAGGAAAGFAVEDLVLRDGELFYSDEGSGRRARLAIDGRLSAVRESEASRALTSRGSFEFRAVRALVPDYSADSLQLPDLDIEYEAYVDLPGDSLALRNLQIALGEVPLAGSGSLRGLRGVRAVDFSLQSGDVDIATLLASLPTDVRPQQIEAEGTARLALSVVGAMGGGTRPDVRGTIELQELAADHTEYGRVLSGGTGQVNLSLGSASVPSFKGQLLGGDIELQANVVDFKNPVATGRVRGDLNLSRLTSLQEDARPMEGVASVDLEFSGPPKRRSELRLSGPVRLSDVTYQPASLNVPARIASSTVRLTGTGVTAENLEVALGESDLSLSFNSERLLQWMLDRQADGAAPLVEFSATSRRLNLSEVMDTAGPGYGNLVSARLAGRRVDGRDPAEVARARYSLTEVPPLNASGAVRIDELINPPMRAQNVAFSVRLRDGVLEVGELQGTVYGGQLAGGLSVDFSAGQPPYPLRYDIGLSSAQAAAFLERWTQLGSVAAGVMDFKLAGRGSIDESLLPAPEALDGAGRSTFREGRFQNFSLTNSLTSKLKLDPARLSSFKELGGNFTIQGGRVLLDDWKLDASDVSAVVGGSAGLTGDLALQLMLEVPPSTLQKAGLIEGGGALGDLTGLLGGADQAIQVAIGIGGTMASPAVEIDTEALREELAKRVEGEGKDLLRRLFKPPPD